MIGININDKSQPFTQQIIAGDKTVETRSTPTLRPYVGKRVGIIRTGVGRAHVVAYADITHEIQYSTAEHFKNDADRHLVTPGSPFDKTAGFGYLLKNVRACPPIPVKTLGIVSRQIDNEPTLSDRL